MIPLALALVVLAAAILSHALLTRRAPGAGVTIIITPGEETTTMPVPSDIQSVIDQIGPAVKAHTDAATATVQAELDAANAANTDLQAKLDALSAGVTQDTADTAAALTSALSAATA